MPNVPNATAMERGILAAMAGGPIGTMIIRIKNTDATFDLEAMSEDVGSRLGTMMTMEAPADQDQILDNLFVMLSKEPHTDNAAIALVRCMCQEIRQHLADDAVAREFARRVARYALRIYRLAQIATFGPNAGKTARPN